MEFEVYLENAIKEKCERWELYREKEERRERWRQGNAQRTAFANQ